MPFIRCARDKRGYESTYVMHVYRPGQGNARTRVLYLFRSPSHVKIGRQPLDPEVMEALEHTHPDLSFDWNALSTEREREHDRHGDRAERFERHERPSRDRRDRPAAPRPESAPRSASGPTQPAPAPQAPVPVVDDTTLLGRILGGSEAARLRARFIEVRQRVLRRARTPEDRERLNVRAERLNPDDWADEPVILSQAAIVEAEWNAILAELPGRRRGRRGGRNRGGRPDEASGPSGIMEDNQSEESHADSNDAPAASDQPDRDAAAVADDRGALGADAAGTDIAPDPDLPGRR